MTGRFCSTAAAGSTDIYPPDDFSSFSIGLSANQRKRNLTLSQLRTRCGTASYLPKCQRVGPTGGRIAIGSSEAHGTGHKSGRFAFRRTRFGDCAGDGEGTGLRLHRAVVRLWPAARDRAGGGAARGEIDRRLRARGLQPRSARVRWQRIDGRDQRAEGRRWRAGHSGYLRPRPQHHLPLHRPRPRRGAPCAGDLDWSQRDRLQRLP